MRQIDAISLIRQCLPRVSLAITGKTFPPIPEDRILDTYKGTVRPRVAYIAAGCVIGFLVASFAPLMINATAEASPSDSAQGLHEHDSSKNVMLTYSYETSPSSTAGDDSLAVDSIEFYPSYVLVRASNGKTSLIAVERLRQFSYRPAASQ